MLKFQTRVMVVTYVFSDVVATAVAWVLAYLLRFHADPIGAVIPVTKGIPPLADYLLLLPLMALLWPAVLYFHGLYRVRRGRSRIDELFAILASVLIASALTLGATLYIRVYYRYQPAVAPRWEYSQAVFALFVVLDVLLIAAARSAIRAWQERQWAAGQNVTRVAVAGTGELGRIVAEALARPPRAGLPRRRLPRRAPRGHGAPGPARDRDARRGLRRRRDDIGSTSSTSPCRPRSTAASCPLIQCLTNECVDVKVVPDVVQYATIKAALEDLDGIPIISLNEVPLQGWNSMIKRAGGRRRLGRAAARRVDHLPGAAG